MERAFKNDADSQFGRQLVVEGKVDQAELDVALDFQEAASIRFTSALVRTGAISEDSLLESLSSFLSLPVLSSSDLPDLREIYQEMASGPLNFDWYMAKSVVSWSDAGGNILYYFAKDIFDSSIREVLTSFFEGKQIERRLCTSLVLDKFIEELKKENSRENLFNDKEHRELRDLAEEAPVVEFVNNVIAQAVDLDASDIHIEPEETEFKVRLRIDGVLHDKIIQPMSRYPAVASRIKLVSGLDIAERRLPQDGRMTTKMGGLEMDVRVSSTPSVHGESVVMRLLPKEEKGAHLTSLGMEKDHLDLIRSWSKLSSGIVLVTGPTGSGKSTTLHAALNDSNNGARKIITVEDPVEMKVPGLTQIQTHDEIGYTFASALRAILRQDPDVIMIGEIRDLETAEIAIQAALSGHLVLSTLHTNDALSAFVRLIDMGVEPFLAAAPVKGLQAQRLVRRICEKCSRPSRPPSNIIKDFNHLSGSLGNRWLEAVGCEDCQGTGYNGRLGVYELIDVDPELQESVVKGMSLNQLRKLCSDNGQRTLMEDGMIKASFGKTTVEELYRVLGSEGSP